MLEKISSKYILKYLFDFIGDKKKLKITHGSNLQKQLEITLDDYKKIFNQIEIEIDIDKSEKEEKINFLRTFGEEESLYEIYFDNRRIIPLKKYITPSDNVSKIKVVLDEKIKSLSWMFAQCKNIKKIKVIKDKRNDITDMSYMFYNCFSLTDIDISLLKTENIKDINNMFFGCEKLQDIDLSSFNAKSVTNTDNMFFGCYSLKKLLIPNNLNLSKNSMEFSSSNIQIIKNN